MQSAAYGDPYQNDQIFTRGGFSWIPVHRAVRKEDSGGSWIWYLASGDNIFADALSWLSTEPKFNDICSHFNKQFFTLLWFQEV